MTTTKIGNTLASCVTSPYLLQHAHNPVHWMPWGLQAHRLAKQLNKPIFLSIGYTSCHWCHVMERESFENEEIAQMLNEYFVNIKVDKEERPDVDRVYMTYVQATTGSGGWPLSVFLTPDLKPFVGGTYFPPEEKFGHTGFKTLIKRVHKVWSEDAQTVEIKASNMFNMMKSSLVGQYGTGNEANLAATGSIVDVARRFYRQMAVRFNKEYGGFSEAPLFPRPSEMQCLLALSASGALSQQDRKQSVNMVLHTLRKMSHGGIHDHIGGGFSRYSVDECWHVPHFEKMLYDNAQLLQTFSSAFKVSHDPYFASVADGIFDYIKRDMTHSSGAFYSAQDADSCFTFDSSESKEGAYYIYTRQEVLKLLPGIIGEIFCFHYNIMEGGNCNLSVRSDPHGEFQGFSVPIELGNDPVGQTAQQFKRDRNEIINILKEGSRELLKWRQQNRPPPVTDDKIITAWNAMMISACARAHCSFVVQTKDGMPEQTEFLKAAIRAMESLENNMFSLDRSSGSKRLLRSIRYVDDKPIPGPGGFADDYAWMIAAYLDLYEATADHNYIQRALALQDLMDAKFKSGDSYLSSDPKDDPTVLIQLAELHDGAEPSPNSVALGNLYRLRNIIDTEAGQKYTDMANAIWNWARPTANELPNALPFLLANNIAFDANADRLLKIVIMAEKKDDLVKQFLRAIYSRHLPGLQLICITSKEAYEYFSSINNTIKSMAYLHDDQQPRLHLCAGFTCYPPITQISALSNMLNDLQEKEHLSQ